MSSPPLLLILLVAPLHAERVDRVVAVVGERVVTESDLVFEEEILPSVGCPEPVLCDPARPLLERVVDLAVIRGLAGDSAAFRPAPEEVERRLAAVETDWQSAEGYAVFLAAFGMDRDDLAGLLYSRMVVERYVQRNVMLPALAAGGDETLARERYLLWIAQQRSQAGVRYVPPLDGP